MSKHHDVKSDAKNDAKHDAASAVEPEVVLPTDGSADEMPLFLSPESAMSAQNTQLVEQLQRLQAEFANYRTRVEREQIEARESANDSLLREILPTIDTFQLAITHAKDEHGVVRGDDLLTGVILINDQLKRVLEHAGVKEIPEAGMFNPRMHEALMAVDGAGAPKGTIIQTLQRGYQRGERVLQPAKVSVAK